MATLAFSMMPRTVSLGSFCSFSLQNAHASAAVFAERGLSYPKNCRSSRLHQWYMGFPMDSSSACANFSKRSKPGLSPVTYASSTPLERIRRHL